MHRKIPVSLIRDIQDPLVQDLFTRIENGGPVGVKNIHRVLANTPKVFSAHIDFSNALRYSTELDPSFRELAILRALSFHHGHYEIVHHKKIGSAVGLSDAEIDAACGDTPSTTFEDARKKAVIAFAEQFAKGLGFTQSTVDEIKIHFSDRFIVELSLTLSIYIGLAYFTSALDVPED